MKSSRLCRITTCVVLGIFVPVLVTLPGTSDWHSFRLSRFQSSHVQTLHG